MKKQGSPSKVSANYPQAPLLNTHRDTHRDTPITKRIWIKKPDGTPTSLFVKESHIIDDLKTMIVERFPTTLAKICDPSDVVIKFDSSILVASPGTPGRKFFGSDNNANPNNINNTNSVNNSSITSPLSPIPVVAKQYNLDPQKPLINEFGNLSIRANSPRVPSLYLEPDRSVWQVLDTFFPLGMTLENAFTVELPPHLNQQLQYQQISQSPQHPSTSHQTYQNQQVNSVPQQRKSFSTEPILEGKEDNVNQSSYVDQRKMSSLPNQHSYRSQTPSGYRKKNSSSADHSSAVLLLPSSHADNWKKSKRHTNSADIQTDSSNFYQNNNPSSAGYPLKRRDSEPPVSTMNLNTFSTQNGESSNMNTNSNAGNASAPPKIVTSSSSSLHARTPSRNTRLGEGSSTMAKVLPSISVLIVEDNLVNLRILSAHLRRHGIHYDTAKNGKEAIEKWRRGGFHLVLMDIQLPVMSGLDASREIRRLEKINHIGVFAKEDLQNLPNRATDDVLDLMVFRSPIIIVALTASNLKQDKQEALAAGCNDYLTKPVNLDWLLNKITEWGCMQALIDFDGWKSGERMTNISAAIPTLTRKKSTRVH
jgi:osomolarity two-component system response regulator SSK1